MVRPVRIIQDRKHPNMYRLQWKNGDISVKYYDPEDLMKDKGPNSYGMYNLSRANDILKNYDSYIVAMEQSKRLLNNKLARRSKKAQEKTLEDSGTYIPLPQKSSVRAS